MPPKAAEGGKAKKPPKPNVEAARAGLAACQGAEGCGLPQAKLWEKGAAFMAFLNASRQKQEDDKVNLVEKAAEVYPACLDMWFASHAAESPPSLEAWSTHPENKGRGKVVEPRRYTVEDSKKYRASSAWGLGKEMESSLKVYSELFSSYLNGDGTIPSGGQRDKIIAYINRGVAVAKLQEGQDLKMKACEREIQTLQAKVQPGVWERLQSEEEALEGQLGSFQKELRGLVAKRQAARDESSKKMEDLQGMEDEQVPAAPLMALYEVWGPGPIGSEPVEQLTTWAHCQEPPPISRKEQRTGSSYM